MDSWCCWWRVLDPCFRMRGSADWIVNASRDGFKGKEGGKAGLGSQPEETGGLFAFAGDPTELGRLGWACLGIPASKQWRPSKSCSAEKEVFSARARAPRQIKSSQPLLLLLNPHLIPSIPSSLFFTFSLQLQRARCHRQFESFDPARSFCSFFSFRGERPFCHVSLRITSDPPETICNSHTSSGRHPLSNEKPQSEPQAARSCCILPIISGTAGKKSWNCQPDRENRLDLEATGQERIEPGFYPRPPPRPYARRPSPVVRRPNPIQPCAIRESPIHPP